MSLKLHTLPILERWDCHQCTACCRETTILLSAADLAQLREQRWDKHPEFRGVRITGRSSWLAGTPVLAHQSDGSCVFLTAAGRCRIHELYGPDAKPQMCRQFPLQLVVTDRGATATVLRSCPSAAADRGRPLAEHLPDFRRLLRDQSANSGPPIPPPIARRAVRHWDDFHRVADALARLALDERVPLVRRLVHGLRFCALIEECKWKRITAAEVAELAAVLEQSAPNDVGDLFRVRQPPSRSAARLFRRLGAHFIRCVPGGRPTRTWLDHWRVFRLSGQLARARQPVPELHPAFPAVAADQLERPLGPLADEVLQPLDRFFESQVAAQRFAVNSSHRSLAESFCCLAFTFPMALWMLRWISIGRQPTGEDMIQVVVSLERGIVLPALDSAAGYLSSSGDLERLVAWYGR